MYETYYDTVQPFFRPDELHWHYMDCDNFVLNIGTKKNFDDFQKLEYFFEITLLKKHHDLFGKRNKIFFGIFKIENV